MHRVRCELDSMSDSDMDLPLSYHLFPPLSSTPELQYITIPLPLSFSSPSPPPCLPPSSPLSSSQIPHHPPPSLNSSQPPQKIILPDPLPSCNTTTSHNLPSPFQTRHGVIGFRCEVFALFVEGDWWVVCTDVWGAAAAGVGVIEEFGLFACLFCFLFLRKC